MSPRISWLLALSLCLLLGASLSATAQVSNDERLPLGDLIEILRVEDELIAIDAEAGGTSVERLRLGERVLWTGTRGLVGVVITDQRILAIATRSASWQTVDYERGERAPESAQLGDRVALVSLRRRVLGFVGPTSRIVEERLGPQQTLHDLKVGANVAVVVTDREALGLSSKAGGFFAVRLQLREEVEEVATRANVATVRTDQRVLAFRAPSGSWSERRR